MLQVAFLYEGAFAFIITRRPVTDIVESPEVPSDKDQTEKGDQGSV